MQPVFGPNLLQTNKGLFEKVAQVPDSIFFLWRISPISVGMFKKFGD